MGADVVKLADVARADGGPARSQYAAEWLPLLDRNKRSAAFDFTFVDDRAAIARLAAAADVIIEGSRPGALAAKTGIDVDELRRRRPDLVLCSVSGFGQTGPLANQPAHGLNLESLSYCLYPERRDGKWALGDGSNLVVAVEIGPVNAAFAIVAALWNAKRTGEGAWIDISCWDAAVEAHRHRLTDVINGRKPWYDVPNSGARYTIYDTADGRPVFFGAGDPHFWAHFCAHVGREDLLAAGRGAEDDARLRAELEPIFLTATAAEWNDRFREWNVAGSNVIMSLEELASHPHFEARGMTTELADGTVMVTDPIRWVDHDSRPGDTIRMAAGIGADTDAVVAEWLP